MAGAGGACGGGDCVGCCWWCGVGAPSKGEAESLKARAQGLVEAGYPAALAAVSDSKGESAGVAVGKGNLETGQAPPMDGEVRVGSNTKTFVAVVVMQMVQGGQGGAR